MGKLLNRKSIRFEGIIVALHFFVTAKSLFDIEYYVISGQSR